MLSLLIITMLLIIACWTINIDTTFGGLTNLIEVNVCLTVIRHGLVFLLLLSSVRLITLRSSFTVDCSHTLQTSCRIQSLLTYFVVGYFLVQIIDSATTMLPRWILARSLSLSCHWLDLRLTWVLNWLVSRTRIIYSHNLLSIVLGILSNWSPFDYIISFFIWRLSLR